MRYEFVDLPVPPQNAELIVLAWNWTDIAARGGASYLGGILAYFEELTREGGDNVFGLLKLNHRSAGQVKLLVQANYDGAPGTGSARSTVAGVLARHGIDHVVTPVGPSIGHPASLLAASSHVDYRWWEIVQQLNGSGDNQKGKYKSAHMRAGFPDDQVRTIYKYLTETRSEAGGPVDLSSSLLQVDTYGGAINRIAPGRDGRLAAVIDLQASVPDLLAGPDGRPVGQRRRPHCLDSAISTTRCTRPMVGCPTRFATRRTTSMAATSTIRTPTSTNTGWRRPSRLYYAGNLARLKQAKARFDPQNRFRHAQSDHAAVLTFPPP